jgi:hypothetical protein
VNTNHRLRSEVMHWPRQTSGSIAATFSAD